MRRHRTSPARLALAALLATTLAGAPAALADPPGLGMGPHPGMHPGMMGPGMDMGKMDRGWHDGGHRFAPHNAAVHFLGMADRLGLDAEQTGRLRELRDAWIEAHSADEARLKAAEQDLQEMLGADTIALPDVEAELAVIGKLEGPLWQAFVRQLAEIKGLLNDDQKARLRGAMRHHAM